MGEFIVQNAQSQPTHDVIESHGLYNSSSDRTFVVWQGQDLDPYATHYDHATAVWGDVVKVGDNPLTDDDHGAPALTQDENGILHVFWGMHDLDGEFKHAISDSANDATSWTVQSNLPRTGTYPNPEYYNGTLYVFYRDRDGGDGERKQLYLFSSTDNGSSWTDEGKVIDFGASSWIYPTASQLVDGELHLTWVYRDRSISTNSDMWQEVFHARYDFADSRWLSMDGTALGSTITETEARNNCLVFDPASNTEPTSFADNAVDPNGNPHIVFSHERDSGTWAWFHSYWDGSQFTSATEIDTRGDGSQFGRPAVKAPGASDVTALFDTNSAGDRSGDLVEWNWDGTSWSQVQTVVSDSNYSEGFGSPTYVQDFQSGEFESLFAQIDANDFSNNDLGVLAFDGTGILQYSTSNGTNTGNGAALNFSAGAVQTTSAAALETVGVATPDLVTYDSFEDQDISEYTVGAGSGNWSTTATNAVDGGYALNVSNSSGSKNFWWLNSTSGLDDYPTPGDTWRFHASFDESSIGQEVIIHSFAVQSEGSRNNQYMIELDETDGEFAIRKRSGGSQTTVGTPSNQAYSAGVTYEGEIVWGTDGSISATLFDESGAEISTTSGSDSEHGGGGFGFETNVEDGHTIYWDYVREA